MKSGSFALLAAILTSACGDSGDSGASEEDLSDIVQQGWGEAMCPCYLDAVAGTNELVESPDGNYDHSQCRHAFVAGGNLAGSVPFVGYAGPLPTPTFLGCNATWAVAQFWRVYDGRSFGGPSVVCDMSPFPPMILEKVAESPIAYGSQAGNQCIPAQWLGPPSLPSGGYKIVAQAGIIFSHQPVMTGFIP